MGKWKHVKSTYVHENPFYKVRRDEVITPDGKNGLYHVVESGRSVFIVAINSENEILLIHQFRYPTQMESWEIPAGGADEGENLLSSAKRELLEETGYEADEWKHIGTSQHSPSKLDGIDYVYVCRGLRKGKTKSQKLEGIDSLAFYSMEEIMSMINSGDITDNTTLAPIMLAIAKGELTV